MRLPRGSIRGEGESRQKEPFKIETFRGQTGEAESKGGWVGANRTERWEKTQEGDVLKPKKGVLQEEMSDGRRWYWGNSG